MRKLCMLGALLLVLTACSSTPSPVTGEFDVEVVFDGETCVYDGPTLIALDSTMTVEFDESAHAATLIIGHARDGTTWEEIVEYYEDNSAGSVPPFADTSNYRVQIYSGSMVVALNKLGDYGVVCATAPEDTNKGFPAALIEVVEA